MNVGLLYENDHKISHVTCESLVLNEGIAQLHLCVKHFNTLPLGGYILDWTLCKPQSVLFFSPSYVNMLTRPLRLPELVSLQGFVTLRPTYIDVGCFTTPNS